MEGQEQDISRSGQRNGSTMGDFVMQEQTLKEAVKEAKRFIRATKMLGIIQNWSPGVATWIDVVGRTPAINAAIKRASLDLTKKLADLRMGR
jgi:hypothetical protein